MLTQALPDGPSNILHCFLLGAPQLAWDGTPLAITRRQTRAMLYLLSNDLRPTPRAGWPGNGWQFQTAHFITTLSDGNGTMTINDQSTQIEWSDPDVTGSGHWVIQLGEVSDQQTPVWVGEIESIQNGRVWQFQGVAALADLVAALLPAAPPRPHETAGIP